MPTITVPEGTSYAAASVLSSVFLLPWQGIKVSGARKAAGIAYPRLNIEKAEMDASPVALKFNYVLRAHANTLENIASIYAMYTYVSLTCVPGNQDLAALLPNLSQIRRPSKFSIVNSSITPINAFRRYRVLASQQLRLLKSETDALRHEVNEWRMRARVPAVEEPRRADGFAVVLSGELEFEAGDMMEGGEETIAIGPQPHSRQSHSPPHFASPPSTAAFENSMYDQHTHQLHHHQLMLQHHQQQQQQESKWAYQQQMRAQQVQMQGAW
ncbi:BHLH domain-containing protein [Mycena sanguinolenta]|uniref:BHLH domain-containing protein n=1 Tax=Mycena sanguinolenta TaxID=230812 RepID=A0A8H7D8T9_9AGAR|nr:BHLH domain-containing protein [Mycena sanguinolenta]